MMRPVFVVLLVLSACEPPPPPDPLAPLDERARELLPLKSVPSFAGLRQEAETLIVFVHDEADAPAVLAIVPDVEVRTRPRRDDLPLTNSAIADDAWVDGMVLFDVDEVRRYLVFGLMKASAIVPLQEKLEALRVPVDETLIRIERPFVAR